MQFPCMRAHKADRQGKPLIFGDALRQNESEAGNQPAPDPPEILLRQPCDLPWTPFFFPKPETARSCFESVGGTVQAAIGLFELGQI